MRSVLIIHIYTPGTLFAILTTYITYLGYGFIIGAVSVPNASGNHTEYEAWRYGNHSDEVLLFTDCDNRLNGSFCEFGSANDYQVFITHMCKLISEKNCSRLTMDLIQYIFDLL